MNGSGHWLVIASAVLWLGWFARTVQAQDDDVSQPEVQPVIRVAPTPAPQPSIREEFDQLVLGAKGPVAATVARRKLDAVLARRLAAVDRTCGLTDAQRQKLRLAGRGDIKRLFDGLDDLREKYEFDRGKKGYNEVVGVLGGEISAMRSQLRSGPFREKSLFSKVRTANLSPAQAEKFAERQQLAARSTTRITLGNARALENVATLRKDVCRCAWSPDGSQLGVLEFGKSVQILAPDDFRLLRSVGDGRQLVDFDFSPDGSVIALTENSKTVWLVNLDNGNETNILTDNAQPSVKFSPDGKLLATGGYGTQATLWSVATGERILDLDTGAEGGLTPVFSPDGMILAVGNRNSETRLFEVATGRLLCELPLPMSHELKFDPAGKRLAVVYVDGSLAIWNVATGQLAKRVARKAEELYSLDWSPDGNLLATAGRSSSVTVWNATTLAALSELECSEWVICVRFSPDGTRLMFFGGSTMNSPERFMEVWAVP